MKTRKFFSLPVEITENQAFSFDDSLIPVDIKVMHNGLNLNNSTFFDEAIEDAKESLKNKPILGYIKKADGSDEKDFSGHEIEISFGEDGLKVIYLERPLGTVPETNNYAIIEEDGKKFVFCRGYLWKEYLNSGYEVLKDNPKKSVSMEIVVDDYDINEDGSINIAKYRYLGITILGDDVQPAMTGAELNVVGQFSKSGNEDFYNKIEELNHKISQHFSNKKQQKETNEGGDNLEDKKFEEEAVKTIEQEEAKEFTEEKPKENFELSHDDIRNKIFDILNPRNEDGYREWNYWIMEVFQTYVMVSDENETEKYYRFDYTIDENDEITLSNKTEMFLVWLTQEEKDALEEEKSEFTKLKEDYIKLETEIKDLRQFKADKELKDKTTEIEEVFSKYSTLLDVTDFEDLKEKATEISIEDLEKELSFRLVQKKFDFSKITKKDTTKIKITEIDTEKNPYGSASVYFNKK